MDMKTKLAAFFALVAVMMIGVVAAAAKYGNLITAAVVLAAEIYAMIGLSLGFGTGPQGASYKHPWRVVALWWVAMLGRPAWLRDWVEG